MKKWLIYGTVLMLVILWLSPIRIKADQQQIELDYSTLDFDEVDEMLSENGSDEMLHNQTETKTVGQLLSSVLSGDAEISWQKVGAAFGNSLLGNIKAYMELILQVVGLALISQFFNILTLHFGEGSAGEVGFLCVYGVMILVILKSFQIAYDETKNTVEVIRNLSVYMMPAMAAVAMAGGFPLSSIMQGEALTGGFSLILMVMKNLFAAGVLWITVLEIVNCIGRKPVLNQMISLGRSLIEKGVKTMSALYLLGMGIVGAVTPSADRMVYKVSNTLLASVPVVGSAMSGAMDSVLAGSVLIKNGIGAVGCIVLLCVCLVPVAKLVAFWLIYRLTAAFLAPVADERVTQLLTALGRSTALLLGILVAGMIVFTGVVGILIVTLRQ